jgi:predicted MFS family arabinose efflux permease
LASAGISASSAPPPWCWKPTCRRSATKIQAFNDFLVFGVMALGSFSSGQLLANYGWSAVNLVVFPPVLLALAVLGLAALARRRALPQPAALFPDPGI